MGDGCAAGRDRDRTGLDGLLALGGSREAIFAVFLDAEARGLGSGAWGDRGAEWRGVGGRRGGAGGRDGGNGEESNIIRILLMKNGDGGGDGGDGEDCGLIYNFSRD